MRYRVLLACALCLNLAYGIGFIPIISKDIGNKDIRKHLDAYCSFSEETNVTRGTAFSGMMGTIPGIAVASSKYIFTRRSQDAAEHPEDYGTFEEEVSSEVVDDEAVLSTFRRDNAKADVRKFFVRGGDICFNWQEFNVPDKEFTVDVSGYDTLYFFITFPENEPLKWRWDFASIKPQELSNVTVIPMAKYNKNWEKDGWASDFVSANIKMMTEKYGGFIYKKERDVPHKKTDPWGQTKEGWNQFDILRFAYGYIGTNAKRYEVLRNHKAKPFAYDSRNNKIKNGVAALSKGGYVACEEKSVPQNFSGGIWLVYNFVDNKLRIELSEGDTKHGTDYNTSTEWGVKILKLENGSAKRVRGWQTADLFYWTARTKDEVLQGNNKKGYYAFGYNDDHWAYNLNMFRSAKTVNNCWVENYYDPVRNSLYDGYLYSYLNRTPINSHVKNNPKMIDVRVGRYFYGEGLLRDVYKKIKDNSMTCFFINGTVLGLESDPYILMSNGDKMYAKEFWQQIDAVQPYGSRVAVIMEGSRSGLFAPNRFPTGARVGKFFECSSISNQLSVSIYNEEGQAIKQYGRLDNAWSRAIQDATGTSDTYGKHLSSLSFATKHYRNATNEARISDIPDAEQMLSYQYREWSPGVGKIKQETETVMMDGFYGYLKYLK